jgi:hypothetical protein
MTAITVGDQTLYDKRSLSQTSLAVADTTRNSESKLGKANKNSHQASFWLMEITCLHITVFSLFLVRRFNQGLGSYLSSP